MICKFIMNFCFQVHKYLENYERALSGFEAAALKDPSLNATEEVQKIVTLLDKIENLLKVMFLSYLDPSISVLTTPCYLDPLISSQSGACPMRRAPFNIFLLLVKNCIRVGSGKL